PPKFTLVPNTQSWVLGLANIRGKFLSVSDLTQYVSGQSSQFSPTQKVLCIHHNDQYVRLVVNQVLGIQHFNKKSFFSKTTELDNNLQEYC
ncbi:chemotaxis protein CheW, partial [Acinetobacter schindleri]|uniref:chemotaxis protein CheW n=1 Tax=Acinetobacter schindleri TaxID=108981 RepID=UPI0030FB3C53